MRRTKKRLIGCPCWRAGHLTRDRGLFSRGTESCLRRARRRVAIHSDIFWWTTITVGFCFPFLCLRVIRLSRMKCLNDDSLWWYNACVRNYDRPKHRQDLFKYLKEFRFTKLLEGPLNCLIPIVIRLLDLACLSTEPIALINHKERKKIFFPLRACILVFNWFCYNWDLIFNMYQLWENIHLFLGKFPARLTKYIYRKIIKIRSYKSFHIYLFAVFKIWQLLWEIFESWI